MSGLPREVLKWIQSLDLSYSVRNVKRDFSNGFMVAEVLSRYYPADISMHSFENGSSVEAKTDNWNQLKRFFKKISFECSEDEINDIIHCYSNLPAKPLVNRLYQVITNKKLKQAAMDQDGANNNGIDTNATNSIKDDSNTNIDGNQTNPNFDTQKHSKQDNVPPYAYRTASNTLAEKFRGTDMNKTDTLTNQQTAKTILNKHEHALTQQRIENPERFNTQRIANGNGNGNGNGAGGDRGPLSHKNRDLARGPTKAVGANSGNMQQVSFIKDVQVKKVNDSLLTIRNNLPAMNINSPTCNNKNGLAIGSCKNSVGNGNKASQNATGDFSVVQSFRSPATHSIHTGGHGINSPKYEPLVIVSIDDIFIQCIQSASRNQIVDLEFSLITKSIMTTFFKYLSENGSESQVAQLVKHLQLEVLTQCAESSIASPREFWRMINIITKGFESISSKSVLFPIWLDFAMQYSIDLLNIANLQYNTTNNIHNGGNNDKENQEKNNDNVSNDGANDAGDSQTTMNSNDNGDGDGDGACALNSSAVDIIFELFLDYGLSAILNLVKHHPSKRYPLFSFIIQFMGHTTEQHVAFLKKLQTEIADINIFIAVCTVLLRVCIDSNPKHNEHSALSRHNTDHTQQRQRQRRAVSVVIDEQLLDIYAYYGVYGLSQQSPKIRASSVCILSDLAANVDSNANGNGSDALDIIVPLFETKIMSMVVGMNDDWWEIQSQVIVLCCVILSKVNSSHDICPLVYNTLIYLLNNESNQLCCKSIKIAIAQLSNPMCIVGHSVIYDIYANLLLNKLDISKLMLNKSFKHSVMFSFGIEYHMQCISNYWKGWIVCQVIAQHLKTQRLGNFLSQQLQLVLPAISDTHEFLIEDIEQWRQVFLDLKDYLLVELCDPLSCAIVVRCLQKFLNDINTVDEAVKLLHAGSESNEQIAALFGVLKLLYPNGPQICQETVFQLLQNLVNKVTISETSKHLNSKAIIERLSQAAISLLSTFHEKCPIQFSQSILANFKNALPANNKAPSRD